MKLSQLKALSAVANHGSIKKAASVLGLSQPAVSKSIQLLEEELGARLLERSARGASLTTFGEIVRKRAGSIDTEMRRLVDEVASMRHEISGRLAIGCTPLAGGALVGGLMRRVRTRFPSVEVQVFDMRPEYILRDLSGGILDIGLLTSYDEETFPGMECHLLRKFSTVLLGSGPKSRGPISMEDLLDRDWIEANPSDYPSSFVQAFVQRHGVRRPRRIHRCTSLFLAVELVWELDAVFNVAEIALPFNQQLIAEGKVSVLQTGLELPVMNTMLVYPQHEFLAPAAREIVRLLTVTS